MTFFTIGQGEGGSTGGSKSKGVAKSQPGNDGRAEIKMYIDAFYTSNFLHGYFK
jgi:hypothetical protein